MKKLFTFITLFATAAVTVATSKAGPKVDLSHYYYEVMTSCNGTNEKVYIHVRNNEIIEARDNQLNVTSKIDFRDLGFPYANLKVGLNQTGENEMEGFACTVNTKNETQTRYQCHDDRGFTCNVTFAKNNGDLFQAENTNKTQK